MIVETIESHTAGEPFRVVTSGSPPVPGATMAAKRLYARTQLNWLRRLVILEPRGHADMYGCLVTEPVSPGADFGVLFMHNEGFSTMCGHGIIAMATVAVETKMVAVREPETAIAIDTPAGLVQATVAVAAGRARGVRFRNVPSFVAALDQQFEVRDVGTVRYDLAFGGAFYAFVDAPPLGLSLVPERAPDLIRVGRAITRAVAAARPVTHPLEPSLGFLYGTIFTAPPEDPTAHSRHVCIFGDGELDRSPTGTGVSARLAILDARGELDRGTRIRIESILGTEFGGRIAERATSGPHRAVIPEVDGQAFLTGRAQFSADPDDPLRDGFLLR